MKKQHGTSSVTATFVFVCLVTVVPWRELLDHCIQKSCTTVQQFRPLSCLHLPVWMKTPTIFTKIWTFSSSSRLFASAECLLKIQEMKDFKKSKTKTLKTMTSKTKTSKAKISKTKTWKAKTSKTKTSKANTSRAKTLIFFKGKLCFSLFHNSFNLERITR